MSTASPANNNQHSPRHTKTDESAPKPERGAWWRDATIYQIYLRSFADGSGDGIGDLSGVRSRLQYLSGLGVDALWITPWYPSPMADGGYDVVDYRDIDPMFGDLGEAKSLIDEAHRFEMRVIIDLVANHCSDQHPWFQIALAAGPHAPQRQRFWFRDGRGASGELPPNDWKSVFGGPAWTRMTEPDGNPGQWYLHLFDACQPDFNWNHPHVRTEFEEILRFWLDHGIDGFRVDAADRLCKNAGLPDVGNLPVGAPSPYIDLDGVHEIYRSWRRIVDSYSGERALIGEIWVRDPDRFSRYLRPDELHSAFNFNFLCCPWEAQRLRTVIDDTLSSHRRVAAPSTWVLSNHDVTRHLTRYGRQHSDFRINQPRTEPVPVELAMGTRRARAALLLTLALPGGVYIYQGDELGLWEVEDLPADLLTDPTWHRSGHTDRGRDGCRVPLPWQRDGNSLGFSPHDSLSAPWLPQPAEWQELSVHAQLDDPLSMLSLYQNALRIRRTEPAFESEAMTWLSAPAGVLAFSRGHGFVCIVNISSTLVTLPTHHEPLANSGESMTTLFPDTAVWLRASDAKDLL